MPQAPVNPAAWWSPTQGYLVPAVGRGDGPAARDGRVKRVADNYVVEVPDDAVELGPLAPTAADRAIDIVRTVHRADQAAVEPAAPSAAERVTDGRPALAWLLGKGRSGFPDAHWPFVGPDGECADCPFGTPSCERNPHEYPPNPSDPGEGRYDCSLLDRHDIWGEGPPCTEADWAARARAELTGPPQDRATPHERSRRYLGRVIAGVRAAGWPWLVHDLEALRSELAWGKVDAAAMWAAIEGAE